MDNEEFYDREIAPVLLELMEKCLARDMAIIAVVEYKNGETGRTTGLPANASLPMVMINHCAKTVPNIDGYILGVAKYCRQNGISLGSSIVMERMGFE